MMNDGRWDDGRWTMGRWTMNDGGVGILATWVVIPRSGAYTSQVTRNSLDQKVIS